MGDFDRLSLNTATTKRLTLAEAIEAAQRAGLGHVGLWRDRVAEVGLTEATRMIAESGLTITSLCRGGFLTAAVVVGMAVSFGCCAGVRRGLSTPRFEI